MSSPLKPGFKFRKTCYVCGAEFDTNGPCAYRCRKCATEAKRKLQNARNARRKAQREAAANPIVEVRIPAVKEHRCKFCGKKIWKSGYCIACENDGFAEVNRMFGKTNGWDRKPRVTVDIVPGWRGRKVCGGMAGDGHSKWE